MRFGRQKSAEFFTIELSKAVTAKNIINGVTKVELSVCISKY